MLVRMPIEVDVTYVNKTWFSIKKKANGNIKHYVIGILQRQGRAVIKSLPDNKAETIHDAVLETVEQGAMLYVQAGILPVSLFNLYEVHEFNPTAGAKVNGDIHINSVNSMWRDLKRMIKREHHSVSQKHLQGYCDTVTWHINTRHLSPKEKFELALSNCAGRLTYESLINR